MAQQFRGTMPKGCLPLAVGASVLISGIVWLVTHGKHVPIYGYALLGMLALIPLILFAWMHHDFTEPADVPSGWAFSAIAPPTLWQGNPPEFVRGKKISNVTYAPLAGHRVVGVETLDDLTGQGLRWVVVDLLEPSAPFDIDTEPTTRDTYELVVNSGVLAPEVQQYLSERPDDVGPVTCDGRRLLASRTIAGTAEYATMLTELAPRLANLAVVMDAAAASHRQ